MELSQFTASSPGRLTPTVGGAKAFVPAPLPRAPELGRGQVFIAPRLLDFGAST